ncbi:MAG: diversity-generating retroelement protein bAvd family protein [Bacteroidetes bacterium HGW-Bacteroidetes-4]|jgi:four helix bundle protein|nr:MAG: diversity-generating retroelement protein bAvd family protein [Bacteroidetes bacterium HGW-Bacteroidetes-4]
MGYNKLQAYQKAFNLALKIFEISRTFPPEEKYSLIDQIRRSSRSVCTNMGEAYRKRKYEKHFVSKLSDSDSENTETQIWLDFALAFNYISEQIHKELKAESVEIGKLINYMMNNPDKFT